MKKLFSSFDANATVQWFQNRGIQLHQEADGRMFPITNSSETIAHCLMESARQAGVRVVTQTGVKQFVYQAGDEPSFILTTLSGETHTVDRLLIATGGHPSLQSYDWLAQHGFTIEPPVPSLFTFNCPSSPLLHLSGIAIPEVTAKITGTTLSSTGPVLFTHWGFSGPAILKLSALAARHLADLDYQFQLRLNWLPQENPEKVRQTLLEQKNVTPKQQVASHARFGLPLNVWKAFVKLSEIEDTIRWSEISHKALHKLTEILTNCEFAIEGKTTFKEEFVTCGGIALSEVNPTTLEAMRMPGLYFAGELLDVDGVTGGFNFQNAWTTGYVAGKNIGLPVSNQHSN